MRQAMLLSSNLFDDGLLVTKWVDRLLPTITLSWFVAMKD
jgi:hypothetical protein